ncbi:hypothetical protein INT47_006370 [Mucor saturninus]|uniref:CBM21 domain-containing protein n=1 Tax=Mucor saturninus TaxID=64648 RepID=A0A8H7V8L8_9FUNG|nr:hypothetical protein INT47_006370 [Mucor saturninus]
MVTESETNTVTNEYTRQLVASALSLPSSVKITTKATTPQTDKRIELPTLLKSSLRTPRSASAPCSPTTGLKSVHFNKNNLEDICLFRKAQTPLAISQKNIFWGTDDDEDSSSSSSSSSEDEQAPLKSLVFVNWPTRLSDIIDKKTKNIRIEKNAIRLIDDVIVGKIQVRNIDYHKTVTIRYTFDFWETIDNIGANYNQQDDHKNNTYDVFSFKINVPTNATTMYFAVNYKVGATEYWDNNDGRNYEIQISSKKTSTKKANSQTKEDGLKARYDFGQSIHQAKNNIVLSPTSINMNKNQAVARAKTSVPSIPIPTTPAAIAPAFVTPASAPIPLAAKTMPIPMRRKSSSPTGLSCHSPLASSPTFMDLNSQSYLELVNKYCFYSTSPSRSPMSING